MNSTWTFYVCQECGGNRALLQICSEECGEWLVNCLDCEMWDLAASYWPTASDNLTIEHVVEQWG